MRSDIVVVMGVRFQNPTQMHLAQDNHMIDALAPDRSDQPFGKAILPRRGWRGRLVPDAHGAQSACDDRTIDAIPVADHVARSFIPRECFGDLARNPFRGRMCCDADPDQLSAIQPHYHVGVEQVEANGRDNEQVHGGDILSMITQKGAPSLAWRPASLDHVFGDTRLRDLKPELEEFAVDARRAPKWVLDAHPPDQRAQLRLDLWPTSPSTRFPTPVAAKARPVPTQERPGSNDREHLQGRWKPAIQPNKEPSIM